MNDIVPFILISLFTFIPAHTATSLPLIAAGLKIAEKWNIPLDMGKKRNGIRILGDHKTLRGLIFGVVGGTLSGLFLYLFDRYVIDIQTGVISYNNLPETLFLAFLLSLGSILGDAIESFIKRQMKIAPGESWLIADQIDYIIGAYLLALPFFHIPLMNMIVFMVLSFGLYMFSGVYARMVKMERKWL